LQIQDEIGLLHTEVYEFKFHVKFSITLLCEANKQVTSAHASINKSVKPRNKDC